MSLDYDAGFRAGKRDAHKAMERRIAEAVAAERERAARICEETIKVFRVNGEAAYDRRFMEGSTYALEMLTHALRADFDAAKFEAAASREGGKHE